MPEASAQTGIRTETPADSAALERLYKELDASPGGLSSTEAALRLAQVGPNEPRAARGFDSAAQILRFFLNPLVIILLIASLASGLMGDRISAVLIAVLVLFSVVLNFAQTFRSQKAADDLRKGVAPTATVRRDHDWVEVPRRNLVPGDLIRVEAGAVVPADARLITERDLHVQQAALTGESLPVEKCAVGAPSDSAGADHADTLFLGTSVVSGTGTALVYATGKRTAFGDIAARLSLRPPETEFERGTRQFGLLIMKTVVFMVLFVLTVAVALKHNTFESLLFAVALAVGLTPEFLPMITSITLAQGAVRMARKKVIVKHLESIQNFGSMDVLCSDKTGTLTSGEMAVERSIDPLGRESKRVFELAYLNSNY